MSMTHIPLFEHLPNMKTGACFDTIVCIRVPVETWSVGNFSQHRDVLFMYETPERLIFRPARQGCKGTAYSLCCNDLGIYPGSYPRKTQGRTRERRRRIRDRKLDSRNDVGSVISYGLWTVMCVSQCKTKCSSEVGLNERSLNHNNNCLWKSQSCSLAE